MIYLNGQIWSIHPLAIATARDAAQKFRADLIEQPKQKRKRGKSSESAMGLQRVYSIDDLPLEIRNGVAIVTISDVIVSWASYCFTSHPALQQTFKTLAEQQPKNGCVLLIDSPGGMAKGSAETIDALNALQDSGVTVTAQVQGHCMSAAYKIAAQCRGGIYVNRMDEVGSIGTKIVLDDESKRYQNNGIEVVAITSEGADFKCLGEPGLPITDEQKAFLSEYVGQVHQEFKRCVQDGRGLTDEEYAAVSDGRWWLPEAAQQLKLIDGVRTFDETLAAITPAKNSPFLSKANPMASNAKDTKPAETVPAETKPADTKPAETPAVETKPAPETTPAETKPAESQTKSLDVDELQKWVTTFGSENGTKWFVEAGCTYTQALERHIEVQSKALEAATTASSASEKLLKEVGEKLGQLDPLQLEKKEAKGEAGGKDPKEGMTLAEIIAARNKKS